MEEGRRSLTVPRSVIWGVYLPLEFGISKFRQNEFVAGITI